ncbi:glycosyltransferase family 2 protein [Brucella sp. RRSP16]|uniref:glycosyltransferase family 2 protein n=1 Tax=Brucella sp. RRSP16 TaxID=3453707 RepID=UPI003FCD9575
MPNFSLVIPVYRNEENIPSLMEALLSLHSALDDLEFVLVIDGSPDNSGHLLTEAAKGTDLNCKIIFHSRNFGSFTAIRTGMEMASGKFVAAMAADLQEPPELILKIFSLLESDESDVVFGQRVSRNDPFASRLFSSFFWNAYRKFVLPEMPKGGVDIFGCNRLVLDTVLSFEEPNSSLVAQLFWVGFRRKFVPYVRRPRLLGTSAWNFSKRFEYMMDSILSFTDLPIMMALWLGIFGCFVSLVFGAFVFFARITGYVEAGGYSSVVLLILFTGSLILTVQGILGCYIWRIAENTKRRPLRVISRIVGGKK